LLITTYQEMSLQGDIETVGGRTSTDVAHSTIHKDNVQVSSSVSHDGSTKVSLNVGVDRMAELMARLSTTQAQIDEYTQQRTQRISIEAQAVMKHILEETKEKQRQLLFDAQSKAEALDEQNRIDLQTKVEQLNQEKAQQLADLEKSLNLQQEQILTDAREKIDQLQRDANARKMDILQKAQEKTNAQFEDIANQVVTLGQQDSVQRLASTTTTVITTQAVAQDETSHVNTYSEVVQQS